MEKTIIISNGDKGGCGKSTISNVLASKAVENGSKVLIVEADSSTGGGQPDVAPRFEGKHENIEVLVSPISANKADSADLIADIFEMIEDSEASVVVINTPAGASESLNAVGDVIAEACTDLNYALNIAYSLHDSKVALNGATDFCNSDFKKGANKIILVQNENFNPVDLSGFNVLKKERMVKVPKLLKSAIERIDNETSFYDVSIEPSLLPALSRASFKKWMRQLDDCGIYDLLEK